MILIAFDPGPLVGYAKLIDRDVITGSVEYLRLSHHYLDTTTTVICESFEQRATHADLTPVKAIGIIEYLCSNLAITIHFQTPSQAKHYFTNERLKQLNLYTPKNPHANDAMRHLLYYVQFKLREPVEGLSLWL